MSTREKDQEEQGRAEERRRQDKDQESGREEDEEKREKDDVGHPAAARL